MASETKPEIPIWGVRHVAIKVRDIEAARAWYQDVLGMTVQDEFPGRALFVRFGPYYHHDLAIFQADKDLELPERNAVGLSHIALLIDSLEGVKQWYHFLQSKGVNVTGSSDHGVTRSIYFTDPDGNPFEIYCDNPDWDWRKDGLTKIDPLQLD